MRIPTRKMRPPAHTERTANRNTSARPTQGCHPGIPTGELSLRIISIGVKGGNSESPVAKALLGAWRIGTSMNMGIMTGIMAGKVRFWASLASLQAEPRAASPAPNMKIISTM